jgi:hypothetical protein
VIVSLLIMFGAFGAGTGIAEIFGAANLGTAMAFGQMAFALSVVYVLVKR